MLRLLAGSAVLLAAYVGSYARLSRRGMAEARTVNAPYFFYCPLSDVRPYKDLPRQHRLTVVVFDPVNRVDRAWLGGGEPCRGVTWGFGPGG